MQARYDKLLDGKNPSEMGFRLRFSGSFRPLIGPRLPSCRNQPDKHGRIRTALLSNNRVLPMK